jgi:hypothetical protein
MFSHGEIIKALLTELAADGFMVVRNEVHLEGGRHRIKFEVVESHWSGTMFVYGTYIKPTIRHAKMRRRAYFKQPIGYWDLYDPLCFPSLFDKLHELKRGVRLTK